MVRGCPAALAASYLILGGANESTSRNRPERDGMKALILSALVLVSLSVVAQQQVYLPSGAGKPFDVTRHSVPLNEIKAGGPPKDGIPALDAPKFVSADQARKFLFGKDRVLGIALFGGIKAYPIRIMNLHEIVNDEINGHPITVTW